MDWTILLKAFVVVTMVIIVIYFLVTKSRTNKNARHYGQPNKDNAGITKHTESACIDTTQLWQQMIELEASTGKDVIRIQTRKETCDVKDSKFGGRAALPGGFPYPLDGDGQKMRLLAQINFSQMPPLIGFPSKGILQFFVADDDMAGMDFSNLISQSNFRVIYHEDADHVDFLPYGNDITESEYFPISQESKTLFQKGREPISTTDFQFGDAFMQHAGIKHIDLPDGLSNKVNERFDGSGHKIGGYPMFTQYDPRGENPDYERYDVLLLQIDSDEKAGIMWGDSGVANFFISSSDLAVCKFDDVLYTWDCC